MSIFSRFLPKKKPVEIKNNIPKEKADIRKRFGIYCHSHHGTSGNKLCPKCTALLATAMTKMDRCPYGITKPICDRCEMPCFGDAANKQFREIMSSSQSRMLLRHPVLAVKHKMASMSFDYAKHEQEKRQKEKSDAKVKNAREKAKAKEKEAKKKK